MAYTYKTKKLTIPAGQTSAQVQLEQGAIVDRVAFEGPLSGNFDYDKSSAVVTVELQESEGSNVSTFVFYKTGNPACGTISIGAAEFHECQDSPRVGQWLSLAFENNIDINKYKFLRDTLKYPVHMLGGQNNRHFNK